MHSYTPEAAQAIESPYREFNHRLMVDWNNNGLYNHALSDMSQYVTRTSRDQAISSTAPDELMLIEGFGAGSLKIEVAGDYNGLPLTGHFAPYNGRSIFYANGLQLGVSMYYEIGVCTDTGWEWFRQFTGVVREVDSNRGEGIVRLDCLDNVEKLRTGVNIPAYGIPLDLWQQGYKRGGLVDSSSIIDMAARSGGFTMGPKPGLTNDDQNRATILSVPMHGSYLPEIGMMDNAEVQEHHHTELWETDPDTSYRSEAYRAGPHGYLALNAVPLGKEAFSTKKYWVTQETDAGMSLTGSFLLGCWVYWEGNDASADSEVISLRNQQHLLQLIIEGSNGGVNARFQRSDGSGGYTLYDGTWLFLTPGWSYIEAGFQTLSSTSGYVKLRTRINNTTSAITQPYTGNLPAWNDYLSSLVTVQNRYAISDLEIHRSEWGSDLGNITKNITLANTADVSWGRNRVTYTLRQKDAPAWDLAKDLAAAEYGVVMFDEFGKFIFWNFDDVTALQSTVQRTFDLSQVEGLSMRTTMDSVRNKWIVTTNTGSSDWNIMYDLSKDGVPWYDPENDGILSSDDKLQPADFRVQPGIWNFFYIQVGDDLMCPDPGGIPTIAETDPWDERAPFHAKKPFQGDTYVSVNNTFETEQKWVTRDLVRLSIWNGNGTITGFWLNAKEQGRFRIRGSIVREDEPKTWNVSDSDSITKYGTRVIELKDNFWLQDKFQTETMLEKIVAKFGRPIPVTDNVTVPGDPRIQIGDVIEINDIEGMGEVIKLQIYGIQRELEDGSGLTDTYQVEVIENPGVGIWDSTSYGLWDQSFIWSD